MEQISLWMEQAEALRTTRPALADDLELDVAIIGAGFTGLWAAYYLKQHNPQLQVALFEAKCVGYGASGRNGGWLLGQMLGQDELLAGLPDDQRQLYRAIIQRIPDDVLAVLQREGIDCGYRKGGELSCAARYPEQLSWLQQELRHRRALGYDEADYRWLSAAELTQQVGMYGALGAIFSPHCATVHPAKLVLGLAAAVERLGVSIYEQSPVTHWQRGELRVVGSAGERRVRAGFILPCVEGYAIDCPPLGRYQIAVQSLQIATEPLDAALWAELGMAEGQAIGEHSRMVTYFHRTRDDRLVFGARGSYRFGGRLRQDFTLSEQERGRHRALMLALFPQLQSAAITHGWGGNLGMARRFVPHLLCDPEQGVALAGGYGGEGVGFSYLAGRTLADLVLGRDLPETVAPWVVNRRALAQGLRRWEPEPLRWLGYNAVIAAYGYEDRVLANPHSAPWRRHLASALAQRLSGLMASRPAR